VAGCVGLKQLQRIDMILGYIDPGSGSVVLQMLIAGAIGSLAFFRGYLTKFFRSFRSKKDLIGEADTTTPPK
jgi:hypothetical protein